MPLPDDLVYFAGHQGQFIVIVPSRELVGLRMRVGQYPQEGVDPILHAVLDLVVELARIHDAPRASFVDR